MQLKYPIKIWRCGKSAGGGDLLNAQIAVFQQVFCIFQTALCDIGLDGHSLFEMKDAGDIGRTEVDNIGKFLQGDVAMGVFVDILDNQPDRTGCSFGWRMSKRLGKGGRRCISPFSFVQTILDGIQYLGFLGGFEQIGIQSIVNRLFGEFKLCIGGVEQDDGVGKSLLDFVGRA